MGAARLFFDAFQDRLDRLHVADVVGFFAGRFQDRGLFAQLGVREQRAKAFEADVAFADVPVAVAMTAERNLGVVEMEHRDALEPDLAMRELEEAVDAVFGVDRVA